ncbi:hypothetical protein TBLA_0E02190 [Henningerozyma blattae CBS 6284]|uniref:Structural maintenance of chromosomes protein 5 n=1 Tax=Henningerozyma blattae (strain ATCC 34711 / CBS 6284 / DSM 70876 / NBRC 10599 / NRRL Y-10934 / UCD 77-7) TaxID=1071380 RepID=I2H4H0_HENB6|nr:hypothetical protein TBLA_0E02190 [Tetrapisispora blattae CBS 6284]CCH61272.1 hypothetical protein TBLA_0E02190 [Tetrapisispora blattae CBS 6284]
MATTINLDRFVSPTKDRQISTSKPARKRLKITAIDTEQFQPGSIIKIKLWNFVTYSLAEFTLSPSLNMIIGPNGSGKSTFVCAVCLGLAGKPEYIGRSSKLEDYIKNGEDQSVVEVTLKNVPESDFNTDTILIKTTINRGKKKPEYAINGSTVTETYIRAFVKKLNIQLDNLCQFLSQERVEEFARLKSDKLLEETIRSIDSSMLTSLEKLKTLQTTEISLQKDVDLKNKKLQELTAQREKLEGAVKALKEYEHLKKEIEIHQLLLPYVKIKDHKSKVQSYIRDFREAKQKLKSFLQDKKPFIKAKNSLEKKQAKYQALKQDTNSSLINERKKLNSILNDLGKGKEEIIKRKKQIEYYENRTKKLQESIRSTEKEKEDKIASLETLQLPDQQTLDEITNERNTLIEKESNITTKIRSIDSRVATINHEMMTLDRQQQERKKKLTTKDKIGILDSQNDLNIVKQAVLHIRANPELQGKFLEPPIITISADDMTIASYLNHCVEFNTAKALTLADSNDFEKYGEPLLKKFPINLREIRNVPLDVPVPRENLREFGFEGYLSDFIHGTPKVKRMLCEIHKIHTIPISRRELSPSQLETLCRPNQQNSIYFRRFIHGNNFVNVNKSEYGTRQIYTNSNTIKPNKKFYLGSGLSEEMKESVKQEIITLSSQFKERQEELGMLSSKKGDHKSEISDVQKEIKSLSARHSELNSIRNSHSFIKSTIERLEERLQELNNEIRKDVSTTIDTVQGKINELVKNQTKLLKAMTEQMNNIKDSNDELFKADIKFFEAYNLNVSMNDVIAFFNEKEQELSQDYTEKKNKADQMRKTDEYNGWIQQINSYSSSIKEVLNDYATKYQDEDKFDIQTITSIISNLESRADLSNHDESSLSILKDTIEKEEELKRVLPADVESLKITKNQMKAISNVLVPKLDEVITKISSKFASLFTNVGSAGQVYLDKAQLYSDWQIEIRVKFRDNAALSKLDSHTQSGGERAVSTVLYMIALQEFTSAPFRVVDEINQGMDSRNERIIHKAMVENACAENTSQYFLITPKLLTNLHYHEKMRIHCVMAGSWIPDPRKDPNMIRFGETSNYII